jgi:hypothetical protein
VISIVEALFDSTVRGTALTYVAIAYVVWALGIVGCRFVQLLQENDSFGFLLLYVLGFPLLLAYGLVGGSFIEFAKLRAVLRQAANARRKNRRVAAA